MKTINQPKRKEATAQERKWIVGERLIQHDEH